MAGRDKPILEGQSDRFWRSALTRALSPSLYSRTPSVNQPKAVHPPASLAPKPSPSTRVHFAEAQGGGGANRAHAPNQNDLEQRSQQPTGHMSLSELESAPGMRGGAVYQQLFGCSDETEPTSLCSEARIASHRYQAARERFLQSAPADLAIARLSQSEGYMHPPPGHVRYSPPPSKSLPHDVRRVHSPPAPPPPPPPPPARPLPVAPGTHLSRKPDASVTEPARGRSSQDQARDLDWSRESRIPAEYERYPPRALLQTANGVARLEESVVRAAPLGQRIAPSFASTPAAPAKGLGRTSSMPVPKSPSSARDHLASLGVSLQNFHLGRSASLHHRKADASEPLNMHALIGNDASRYQNQHQHQHQHQHLEAGAALANDAEAMQVEALLQHVEAIAAYAKTASKDEEQEILALLSKTLELEEQLLRRSGGR